MAHFNPAVTVGYFITKHITFKLLLYYFGAEIIGALIASVFVKYIIGNYANLGANTPNYNFPILVIFGVEVARFGIANGRHFVSGIYKRIERFWWHSNWRNSWTRHFLLFVYFWCVNESCKVFGTCFNFRFCWRFMAVLVCYLCWNFGGCFPTKTQIYF